ncbi:hypothetical protein HK405_006656, partial [Cladochytrium tenue]
MEPDLLNSYGTSKNVLVAADGTRMFVSSRKRVPVAGWPSGIEFGMGVGYGVVDPPATDGKPEVQAGQPQPKAAVPLPVDSTPGSIGNGGAFPSHTSLQYELRKAELGRQIDLDDGPGVRADVQTLQKYLPPNKTEGTGGTSDYGVALAAGSFSDSAALPCDSNTPESEKVLIDERLAIRSLEGQAAERAARRPDDLPDRSIGGDPRIPIRPSVTRTTAHSGKLQPIVPALVKPASEAHDRAAAVGGRAAVVLRPKSAGVRLCPLKPPQTANPTANAAAAKALPAVGTVNSSSIFSTYTPAAAQPPVLPGENRTGNTFAPPIASAPSGFCPVHQTRPLCPHMGGKLAQPTSPQTPVAADPPGSAYVLPATLYHPPGPPPAVVSVVASNPGVLPHPLAANRRFHSRPVHPAYLEQVRYHHPHAATTMMAAAPVCGATGASMSAAAPIPSIHTTSYGAANAFVASRFEPSRSGGTTAVAAPVPHHQPGRCTCASGGAASLYGVEFGGVVQVPARYVAAFNAAQDVNN